MGTERKTLTLTPLRNLVALGSLFVFGAVASRAGYLPRLDFRAQDDRSGHVATAEARSAELVFVYIGSSTCGVANQPWTAGAVQQAMQMVRRRASETGLGFVALGIAKDWNIDDGVKHLTRIANFDEISVGRNWANEALVKYVWRDLPGIAATPQVVVVLRVRHLESSVDTLRTHDFSSETLLMRKAGLSEIETWLNNGAPIRPTSMASDSVFWRG
jgi:hypothetical protein